MLSNEDECEDEYDAVGRWLLSSSSSNKKDTRAGMTNLLFSSMSLTEKDENQAYIFCTQSFMKCAFTAY